MFEQNKNIKDIKKDSSSSLGIVLKDTGAPISYTKTNKLITALYMVTDIMDKDEPLRNKLRSLGMNIVSDINYIPLGACSKIAEIMSFLDIASAINIISGMHANILRKEFLELNQSIKESTDTVETLNRQINLTEFFQDSSHDRDLYPVSPLLRGMSKEGVFSSSGGNLNSKGHNYKGHMRIGVQKGSTLMQALSDTKLNNTNTDVFYILKKQRRDNIITIIKTIGESATIKDIKDKVKAIPEQAQFLVSCSEKTLQRELVSMVKDGVLNKAGEKRWSRYFLISPSP